MKLTHGLNVNLQTDGKDFKAYVTLKAEAVDWIKYDTDTKY